MQTVLDIVFFVARVVLVVYCFRHLLFVLTGTTRTYAEWSKGFGGFLYLAGVGLDLAGLRGLVEGRDVTRVMNAAGLALLVLPTVLHWFAPRLYQRLTHLEDC